MTPETAERELFGEALALTEQLPVRFVPDLVAGVPSRPSASACTLLRVLVMLDEAQHGSVEELDRIPAELERLEAKVDLLLSLFAESLRQSIDTPQHRQLCWSGLGARCGLEIEVPPVGTSGLLQVHADPRLPRPIELRATVLAAGHPDPSGQVPVYFRFDEPELLTSAGLDRHIFRHHRRQIALSRRSRQASLESPAPAARRA